MHSTIIKYKIDMLSTAQLDKFLKLVLEIADKPENASFKTKLINGLGGINLPNHNALNTDVSSFYNDIKRTRFFLKNIDKNNFVEAQKFYQHIRDKELRKKLIIDYKEMKTALMLNDILEYARRKTIQLERCFDYIIEQTNAWEVVLKSDSYDLISIRAGIFTKEFRVKDGFFKKDWQNPGTTVRKDVSEIEFKHKALYCFTYYSYDFITYNQWSNFEDLYFLRNKASHASTTEKDHNRLIKIIEKFPERNIYYNKMFNAYIGALQGL